MQLIDGECLSCYVCHYHYGLVFYLVETIRERNLPEYSPSRISDYTLAILQQDRKTGCIAAR
jgi:hypothetical protein